MAAPEKQSNDSLTHSLSGDPDLVNFDGLGDPAKAIHWPLRRKWSIMLMLSIMSFIMPLASSMLAPAVPECLADFRSTSSILGSLVVSIYLLGGAAGPLVIAPLSEIYGRSIIYHVTNALYIVFSIACALSTNLNMLIGFRFLAGVASAAVMTVGGGTVADLFIQEERGRALAIWTLGALLGPVLGPVIGSFLSAAKGWRWVFWFLAIVSGGMSGVFFIFLRETSSVIILRRKAARLRKETGKSALRSHLDVGTSPGAALKAAVIRPLKLVLFSPIVAAMATVTAIIYGYLYILFTTFTMVYKDIYGFSSDTVGLIYLGLGVGMFLGLFAFGALSDFVIKREAARHDGEMKPEYRLPPMILGGICLPVGLFVYGWTAKSHVFWFIPILGTAIFGFGFIVFFMPTQAYLVDAFAHNAASALAAGAVLRSLGGALLPLAGVPMYDKLGLGWGNTLLGLIAIATIPLPFFLLRYGERIRTSPRFQVRL
ncbi:CefM protein [Aspergillus sclerotioniger CBS 115572]|uniref:CefM protein n=1 Tax=Aspergillus sclerotioniger CBS 115572 TaxID=1450535 RepID=A0A317V9H6_9EURO|nr:CefM protein [Aspergillus sclerotioniger CBS 115572]PWY69647.1 CefM protein [Aspergillus sclerotioniger CBS 115572]